MAHDEAACQPGPPARAANLPQLHSPRGASWPPNTSLPSASLVLTKRALHRSLRRRLFSESHVEKSPPRDSGRALRPVEAPFHETSVTGLRPVGQDCSAATLEPAANAGLSSSAFDSFGNARALRPRPPRRRARPQRWAPARPGSLALHRSRLPPMPSRRMAPTNAVRRSEPPARAANLPQLHSPRGPFRLPEPGPLFLDISRDAEPVPTGQAPPTARPSLHQHTEGHPWGGTHHVIVGRARSRGLPSWHRPLSLPATFDRNLGYFPTRACTRPASRAG
jgi:hypothetical protein